MSEEARIWYQKGYEQAKRDFEKKGIRVYAYLDGAMELGIELGLELNNATLILDEEA